MDLWSQVKVAAAFLCRQHFFAAKLFFAAMPAEIADEVASVLAQLDVAHLDGALKQQVANLLTRCSSESSLDNAAAPPAEDEDDTCTLCLCSMAPEKQFPGQCNSGSYVITTACNHRFHLSCFKRAREHDTQSCPLCRANLAPTGATPTKRTARPRTPVDPTADDRLAMAFAAEAMHAPAPVPPATAATVIGGLGSLSLEGYTPVDPRLQSQAVVAGVSRARDAVRRAIARQQAQREAEQQQQQQQQGEQQEDEDEEEEEEQQDMSMSSVQSEGYMEGAEDEEDEEHQAELIQMQAAHLEREYHAASRSA